MELGGDEGRSLVAGDRAGVIEGDRPSLIDSEKLPPILRGFMQLPWGRQVGLIVALALVIAIGAAILLWSQKTEYEQLFTNIPEKEAGEIVEILKKLNVPYELDRGTGAIRVPAEKRNEVRLQLAGQGYPKEGGQGFEALEKESSFGTSQLMETARFQRALEGEIARSIQTIRSVKSARVHLALPKDSVFVRQAKKSSASVALELQSGYGLEPGQVEAIVHLVASSVPQLEPSQVTVVDQRGHLLNSRDNASEMYQTSKQFDYKKQVEEHLIERIENILSPIVGRDGLRTQVTADLDFTVTERTQELFNPDMPALRSEQSSEEQTSQQGGPRGVPGALSNQPPLAGQTPETTAATPAAQGGQQATAAPATPPEPINASKNSTRNYELDKTISHSRLGSGEVRRLTVAVVVDNQRVLQAGGGITTQPFSDEDLTRFSSLVKEAVGYDAARGDRVTVTNAAFRVEDAVPVLPVWEQGWFWVAVKQVGAGIVVIILIFSVLRPAMRSLTGLGTPPGDPLLEGDTMSQMDLDELQALEMENMSEEARRKVQERIAQANKEAAEELYMLEAPQSYEKRLEYAQQAIDQDAKRIAQVVKTWMATGGANG